MHHEKISVTISETAVLSVIWPTGPNRHRVSVKTRKRAIDNTQSKIVGVLKFSARLCPPLFIRLTRYFAGDDFLSCST